MSNSVDVVVPSIGESITVAYVAEIFVQAGQLVTQGDPIFSVDSDKATLDVPAPCSGVVESIFISKGEEVPIGAVVGRIKGVATPVLEKHVVTVEKSENPNSRQATPTVQEQLLQELEDQFNQGFINEYKYKQQREKIIGKAPVWKYIGIAFFLCIGCFVLFFTSEHFKNTEFMLQEQTVSTETPIVPEKTETERRNESPPTLVSENLPTDSEKSEAIQEITAIPKENSEPDCLVELKKSAMTYSEACAIHVVPNIPTKVVAEIHIQQGLASTIQFQPNDNKRLIHCLERQWVHLRLPTTCALNLHYPIQFD